MQSPSALAQQSGQNDQGRKSELWIDNKAIAYPRINKNHVNQFFGKPVTMVGRLIDVN